MIDRRVKCAVTAVLVSVITVLSGCSKKEEAPAPSPTSAPTSQAAAEVDADTAGAMGQGQVMPGFDPKLFFSSLDTNQDKQISKEEYSTIWRDKAISDRNFKALDKNGDGSISAQEFAMISQPQ